MKICPFIHIVFFSLTLSAFAEPNKTILIRLNIDKDQYKELQAAKIELVDDLEDSTALAVVTQAELALLQERGYKFSQIMTSENELDLYKRAIYGEAMVLAAVYYTYEELLTEIDGLIKKFPHIINKVIIGKTSQHHRDIWAVKISDQVQKEEDEPKILFSAAIHANELIGVQVCMALINNLVSKYEIDAQVRAWVDNNEIWFVPVINVDGHHLVTHNIDPRWRKNARDNNKNGILNEPEDGVDLNRNFDFNWAFGGSGNPLIERYRGEYPFSETECLAMRDFAIAKKFLLSITYHSYGEVIFYPWVWREQRAPDDKLLTRIATELASRIKTIKGDTTYAPHYGSGLVGQTYPWFYGRLGTLDFIVELGKYRHIQPPALLNNIIQSNLPAAGYMLELMKGPGLTGHVLNAITNQPLDAVVFFPDIDTESIDRRTANLRFGRYYRLLDPGKYRVIFMKENYQPQVFKDLKIDSTGWTNLEVKLKPL